MYFKYILVIILYLFYLNLKMSEKKEKTIKVLFIGNSHTYMNDMPSLFSHIYEKTTGCKVNSVMLAYSARSLEWHLKEYLSLRYNILYGKYDYCIIQQRAHPFPSEEETLKDGKKIIEICKKVNTRVVLFMTWAEKAHPENQQKMIDTYEKLAIETYSILAPIGIIWEKILKKYPEIELYYKDGAHASPYGDLLISAVLVKAISGINPSFPDYILDNKIEFREAGIDIEENIDNIKIKFDENICKKIYNCIIEN